MEYLDGNPLSQVIAEGLERDVALRFATQIASGLEAANGQNVVHGDLKPANIIVTKDGTAKILDFGLAKSQAAESPSGRDSRPKQPSDPMPNIAEGTGTIDATLDCAGPTSDDGTDAPGRPSVIQGTPAYMSPEQAAGSPATPASDVFSFGLTLFEMLTGRRALSEQAPIKLLLKLQSEDLRSDLVPQIDEVYRELLAAVLAPDEVERPTMTEVVRRLNASQTSPATG